MLSTLDIIAICVYAYWLVLVTAQVKGGANWFIFYFFRSEADELCVGWKSLTGQYIYMRVL